MRCSSVRRAKVRPIGATRIDISARLAAGIRLGLAALVLAGIAAQPASAARWTRLRSQNFLFIGDASEGAIHRVARSLEQFRNVMALLLPGASDGSAVPPVVILFSSDRAFTPFKPRYKGRPIENVGGYMHLSEDVTYIAMSADRSRRAVFHEYTHFLIANTIGLVPAWLNEGLAEFYQMYEDAGGRAAIIRPSLGHLRLLQRRPLMPLTELLAVDQDSPHYNEADRRGIFYAQSWALVHYLAVGSASRAGQLSDYLDRIERGTPKDDAFRDAFKTEPVGLERELRNYLGNLPLKTLRMNFPERVEAAPVARGEALAEPEAQAYLGDLLARVVPKEGRAYLQTLVASNGQNARASASLGLLDLREGRTDDALERLERAVAIEPQNGAFHGALGRALAEQLQGRQDDLDAVVAILARARAALTRAVELEPLAPNILATLGYVEHVDGADLARATALLEQAIHLAPTRDSYRLMLAEVLVQQKQYDRAASILTTLLARGDDAAIRAEAQALLGRMRTKDQAPSTKD
jgi:cytochrome c-type biogenesis protein CcmH/NrfG